jgi:plastocyanin
MRVSIVAALSMALLVAPLALAQPQAESNDPEELRRELRQMRARMQQLKSALGEAAEFDRMSSEAVARAKRILDGENPAPVAEGAAPDLSGRSSGAGGKNQPGAARRRAATPAPEATGVVRGKVDVPDGEPVAYVFVDNLRGAPVGGKVTIEQVRKTFVPSWAVVQRGKRIEFPNLDKIYHNVFSLSSGNEFDLGLYAAGGPAQTHTFNEAGVVDVHCNIHPEMAASVLVVPNRYFSRVKADGSFELVGVPSGRRKIAAWAPGSKLSSDWVELEAGGAAELRLRLERKTAAHTRKDGRPYGSYE